MTIGKNCIVIGNLVDEIPDNQIVIDMNCLDLSKGPALLGNDKGESPSVLIIPVGEGQIQKAIQMLKDVAPKTPDNHETIDLAALDLSGGPAIAGGKRGEPCVLMFKEEHVNQAVEILGEWKRSIELLPAREKQRAPEEPKP